MRGCTCRTCEGQRAYDRQRSLIPERAAAKTAAAARRVAAMTEIEWAHRLSVQRATNRGRADLRDASQLRGAL